MKGFLLIFILCASFLEKTLTFIDIIDVQPQSFLEISASYSLTNTSFRQVELTSERVYGLTINNVIVSWFKNGTGFLINQFLKTNSEDKKIYHFTLTADQKELVFCDISTKKIHVLSSANLTLLNSITPGKNTLAGAVKTKSKFLTADSKNVNFQILSFMQYVSATSLTFSDSISLAINGTIKIKVNKQQDFAIIWNKGGRYCLIRINETLPVVSYCMTDSNLTLTTQSDMVFSPDGSRVVLEFDNLQNLTVINFRNRSVVEVKQVFFPYLINKVEFFNDNSVIALFHGTNVTFLCADSLNLISSQKLSVSFGTLVKVDQVNAMLYEPVSSRIQLYKFVCPSECQLNLVPSPDVCPSTVNVVQNITNKYVLRINQTTSTNQSTTSSTGQVTQVIGALILSANQTTSTDPTSGTPQTNQNNLTKSNNQTFLQNQTTPINQTSDANLSTHSKNQTNNQTTYQHNQTIQQKNQTSSGQNHQIQNMTNITTDQNTLSLQSNNQTNNGSQILTQNQTNPPSAQKVSSVVSQALQSGPLLFLNKFPSSRRLLKPIFMFFSNFDDLWLYNYINTTYDPVIQEMFDSVQRLQEQKWQTISAKSIWQNGLGVNITLPQQLFNNSMRIAYSSQTFTQISQNANGYALNTLEFFLSNFILIALVHFTGRIIFTIMNRLNLKIKAFFVQYSVGMGLLVFSLDGNIQYMTYLLGFQVKNLWFEDFGFKIYSGFTVIFMLLFMLAVSTLYFILKYFYSHKAVGFYENCEFKIMTMLYLNFNIGVRNFSLGFVQFILPEEQDNLYLKYLYLAIIEVIFLCTTIVSIRKGIKSFFSYKMRQWIMIYVTLLRIFLILLFAVDQNAKNYLHQDIDLSEIYSLILTLHAVIWISSILYELTLQITEIKILIVLKAQKVQKPAQTKSGDENAHENIEDIVSRNMKIQKTKKINFLRVSVLSKSMMPAIPIHVSENKSSNFIQQKSLKLARLPRKKITIKRKYLKDSSVENKPNYSPEADRSQQKVSSFRKQQVHRTLQHKGKIKNDVSVMWTIPENLIDEN